MNRWARFQGKQTSQFRAKKAQGLLRDERRRTHQSQIEVEFDESGSFATCSRVMSITLAALAHLEPPTETSGAAKRLLILKYRI